MRTNNCVRILFLMFSLLWGDAFLGLSHYLRFRSCDVFREGSQRLFSGTGIARDYSWREEAFEIEVTIKVPKDTRAKDLQFKALPRSIDLRLKASDGKVKILLDGNRTMRGRISLDGTFWVISDVRETDNVYLAQPYREVTVTIEKIIRTPKDDFEVVKYDWNGVYPDDEDEVTYRHYDGPEELNVREYAASLGVDIDNLNMSMVDKTMFSSGLNLTQSSLDELTKAGLLREVTQQADGSEFIMNSETGEPEPWLPLGMSQSSSSDQRNTVSKQTIPFLDTDSPWHSVGANQTTVLEKEEEDDPSDGVPNDVVQQKRLFTRAAFAADAANSKTSNDDQDSGAVANAVDPIDMLTVQKLKEILKSQGLKVSGNKKELQDRLRQQVNALLQGKQQSE